MALLLHKLASGFFYLPLLVRFRYERLLNIGFVLVVAWLAIRLVNAFSGVARGRAQAVSGIAFPTLSLASRLLNGFVLFLAVLTLLENLSHRDRFLFQHTIGLRHETTPTQLTAVLGKLRALLVLSADAPTFLGIQEELLLAALAIVVTCGTNIAFPSQTLYLGRDAPPAPSVPA